MEPFYRKGASRNSTEWRDSSGNIGAPGKCTNGEGAMAMRSRLCLRLVQGVSVPAYLLRSTWPCTEPMSAHHLIDPQRISRRADNVTIDIPPQIHSQWHSQMVQLVLP